MESRREQEPVPSKLKDTDPAVELMDDAAIGQMSTTVTDPDQSRIGRPVEPKVPV